MDWTAPRLVAGLAVIIVIFAAHLYLWLLRRQVHLAIWTVAWGLALARYGLLALLPGSLGGAMTPAFAAYIVTFAAICVLLTAGNYVFVGRRPPWWTLGLLAASYVWVFVGHKLGVPFAWRTLPPYLCLGLILFLGGRALIVHSRVDRPSRWSAGLAMISAGGGLALAAPWLMDKPWFALWGWLSTGVISSWVGVSLLMLHFQDQTRQLMETKKTLAATARVYRSLADTMAEGMLVFDDQGMVSYVNPRLCQIFGRAPQDMLGVHVESLLGPASMDERSWRDLSTMLRNRDQAAQPLEIERFTRPGGATLSLRVLPGGLFDDSGRFRGMVLLISDITSRLSVDRELAPRAGPC